MRLRRLRVLAAATAAGSLVALSACGDGGSSAAKDGDKVHLNMFIFAGSHQEDVPRAVVKKYMADNPNVTVDFVVGNNTVYAKMVAAKKTTPDDNYIDFGFFNAQTTAKGTTDKMWQPIDPAAVPNMANVFPDYVTEGNLGVGYQTTLIGLTYNKDKVTTPPDSWTDLWSPEYQGKVSFFDHDWVPVVLASKLNGGSETNMDPGFALWEKNAKQIKALVSSNDQLQSLLVGGQALISPWYAAIYKNWAEQGAPVGFAIPKEGAVAFPIYLTMTTNLTDGQKKAAQDIMNLLLSPENIGEYGRITNSAPLTDNAKLTAEQAADPTASIEAIKNAIQFDWATIGKENATWTQRWDTQVKPKIG